MVAATYGCGQDDRQASELEGERLRSTPVVAPANYLMPMHLVVAGQYLLVGGNDDDRIRVFDRHTGELKGAGGRKGSGPSEFEWLGSLQATPQGQTTLISAYDFRLGRVSFFQLERDGRLEFIATTAPHFGAHELVLRLDSATFVAVPTAEQHRLSLMDSSGMVRSRVGALPQFGENVPPRVVQQMLAPSAAVRPDGASVVLAAMYAAQIDIMHLPAGEIVGAEVPVPFEPVVNVAHNGAMEVFGQDSRTVLGYLGVTASDRYIYALFSGRARGGFGRRANYADQVHVLNWDGRPVGIYTLDQELVNIAVTPDDQVLYGIVWEPEPRIVAFQLGEPRRAAAGESAR